MLLFRVFVFCSFTKIVFLPVKFKIGGKHAAEAGAATGYRGNDVVIDSRSHNRTLAPRNSSPNQIFRRKGNHRFTKASNCVVHWYQFKSTRRTMTRPSRASPGRNAAIYFEMALGPDRAGHLLRLIQ
jgi:hypothetical protein